MEAITSRTGKGGNQGGMNINHGIIVNLKKLFGDNGHKPRHDHNIYRELPQFFQQCHRHGLAGGVVFPIQDIAWDTSFLGSF